MANGKNWHAPGLFQQPLSLFTLPTLAHRQRHIVSRPSTVERTSGQQQQDTQLRNVVTSYTRNPTLPESYTPKMATAIHPGRTMLDVDWFGRHNVWSPESRILQTCRRTGVATSTRARHGAKSAPKRAPDDPAFNMRVHLFRECLFVTSRLPGPMAARSHAHVKHSRLPTTYKQSQSSLI